MLKAFLSDFKTFIALVMLSLLFFLLDTTQVLNPVKSAIGVITIPIQYGLYRTSIVAENQLEFILMARKSSQENKALKEQLSHILSENATLRKKLAEAQGFLDQKEALNTQTFDLVAIRPIGISRFLLIDKGSDEGIKLDQAVVYQDNLLGLIKEVSPKKSKVMLLTDPDSRVAAFAGSSTGRARGVLLGQFGSEMLLDKILHEEPINKGDLVYSEGTEVEIPRGLILGQVESVDEKDNEVFKQAKIKPIFAISDLDIIFIITN